MKIKQLQMSYLAALNFKNAKAANIANIWQMAFLPGKFSWRYFDVKSHFSGRIRRSSREKALSKLQQMKDSGVFVNERGQPELKPDTKRSIAAYCLALGKSCRKTASSVGISTRQLMNWKKDPEFMRQVQENSRYIYQRLTNSGGNCDSQQEQIQIGRPDANYGRFDD